MSDARFPPPQAAPSGGSAFTLVELLVSIAIVAILLGVLISITGQTSSIWRYTTARSEQFREARAAFDTMTARLSQATLNTYWDYDNPALPTRYERRSELRFISGPASILLGSAPTPYRPTHSIFFHAPLGVTASAAVATDVAPGFRGLGSLLNAWGYYVELNDDTQLRPSFLTKAGVPTRARYRLMEFTLATEDLVTYNYTSGGPAGGANSRSYAGKEWFAPLLNQKTPPVHALAENVVALVILPRLSKQDAARAGGAELAPNYLYDSTQSNANSQVNPKNQLPPVLDLTLAAIDEESAMRLGLTDTSADVFNLGGKFQSADKYTADLSLDPTTGAAASLENKLVALKAKYRIFSTSVLIRGAKWSTEQAN